uniref:Uncharacterized protein n=1 Tax=Gopherus agassizii TaxID=38772 RepID=A0A452IEY9_9SAUR
KKNDFDLEKFSFGDRPRHRQDVSTNPRAHVVRAGQTKLRCWWATQPGYTEQLCLLPLLSCEAHRGLGASLRSWAL